MVRQIQTEEYLGGVQSVRTHDYLLSALED